MHKITLAFLLAVLPGIVLATTPFKKWITDDSIVCYITTNPADDSEPDIFDNYEPLIAALPLESIDRIEIYENETDYSPSPKSGRAMRTEALDIVEKAKYQLFFTAGDSHAKAYVYTGNAKNKKPVNDIIIILHKNRPGNQHEGECAVVRIQGKFTPDDIKQMISIF